MKTENFNLRQHGILTAVQFTHQPADSIFYLPFEKAQAKGFIEAKEVSSSGSVNDILALNLSNEIVFIMDGDVLAGAKQNRVLNTSILLAPESKTVVPVSCVERGRWQHRSPEFRSSDFTAPSYMRAMKSTDIHSSLKRERRHKADQGKVWDSVAYHLAGSGVFSASENLSDIYENRRDTLTNIMNSFRYQSGANALAVFYKRDLVTIDVFNRGDVFESYYPKLLRSAALDAFGGDANDKTGLLDQAEAMYKVNEALDWFEESPKEKFPGVGLGNELRLTEKVFGGFRLDYNGHLIHQGIFVQKQIER